MAIFIVISGCGYRPVAREAQATIPDPVYVKVKLSGVEPQNGIYLKERLIETLQTHMHRSVVNRKDQARTVILVGKYRFHYEALGHDRNGYVTRYRVHSTIQVKVEYAGYEKARSFILRTKEDALAKPASLRDANTRDLAIKRAIDKAMDQLIARIAVGSFDVR